MTKSEQNPRIQDTNKRLLIVEDEPPIIGLYVRYLTNPIRAAHVTALDSYREGEILLGNSNGDLSRYWRMIFDINIGSDDGSNLARLARKKGYSNPIFIMSGRPDELERVQRELIEDKNIFYFRKPLESLSQLWEILNHPRNCL